MRYLKTYESFEQPEGVKYFMGIIRDKSLELSDDGFKVKIEDNTNEPLLEKMVRITITKKSGDLFSFHECQDSITDIILTNKELNCFKTYILLLRHNSKMYSNLQYNFEEDNYYVSSKEDTIGEVHWLNYIELFFE